ncbi:MAG: hypothetical protein C0P77_013135 [Thermoanaerobacterales bacterium]|mgnify:CR=1 FL=1|nr:hypothetical protein [Thermoanaerobacterales bacterium]
MDTESRESGFSAASRIAAGTAVLTPTGALIVLLAHWVRDLLYGEHAIAVLGVACVVASGLLLVDPIGAALRRGRVDDAPEPSA